MLLFAQNAPDTTGMFTYFERMLAERGLTYGLSILALWMAWRYGPQLLEGHRNLMSTLEHTAKQNADSTERLTEAVEELTIAGKDAHKDMRQVKQALKHGMAAGEKMLIEHGHSDSDAVQQLRHGQNVLQTPFGEV